MQLDYQDRLDRLRSHAGDSALRTPTMGVERECLRVDPEGRIAKSVHPEALGAALTNPFVTTDYSEALLELITPPCRGAGPTFEFLTDIHQFVDGHLDAGEQLWSSSMPCVVNGDADVPIAHYGTSNVGMMKRIYRVGLGYRYGRTMQAIAGVHFNYSPPPAVWSAWFGEGNLSERQRQISASLFGMVRNLRRYGWLMLYLYGASPAVCRTFFGARADALKRLGLERLDEYTAFLPYATSLRMSDLGYSNKAQASVQVSANSLDEYIDGLTHAITTPWPAYEEIGVRVDGEYRQLNANLLQIENEYYSLVRPKRVAQSGESPMQALRRGGVEYVELRALDVDPFAPSGVSEEQLLVLEAFMLYCLTADSPPITEQEAKGIDSNTRLVARRGREPGLKLHTADGGEVPLRDEALRLVDGMLGLCEEVFAGAGADVRQALGRQRCAVIEPSLTPSARLLDEMTTRQESFIESALRLSAWHREALRGRGVLAPAMLAVLEHEVRRSHKRQREIEATDQLSFEQYLHNYYRQTRRR
ncbi:MAG: glutamate--cysteine ligase [Pseudomonadota bacterium]